VVDQRFPKSCRLLDSKAFELVFNKPDFRVSNKYFLILGSWSASDNARLGIIVAKKNIARATQRNRIKRIIREAFRSRCTTLAAADLVVMARKELQFLENSECHSTIHVLMDEINKKKQAT
jgi:ribonuclease P protein component